LSLHLLKFFLSHKFSLKLKAG
jgi:hypothetical protein